MNRIPLAALLFVVVLLGSVGGYATAAAFTDTATVDLSVHAEGTPEPTTTTGKGGAGGPPQSNTTTTTTPPQTTSTTTTS